MIRATTEIKQAAGILAEFKSQERLISAAEEVRNRGFEKLEAFSPFPIHGLDEAIGVKPSPLPWLVLGAGIVGGISALLLQWWTNTIDYPFVVSGKPLFSLPATIPVTFEVTILAAAATAFFGMLALNGLPKLANPLFRNKRFLRATNNGFFLFVDAQDARFDLNSTFDLLRTTDAESVQTLAAPEESQKIPRGIFMVAAVIGALALIPPAMIAAARGTTSDKPRLHNFFDMDFQPKFKSQTTTNLFADGRAARPRVSGTVPRGGLKLDAEFHYGLASDDGGQPVSEAEDSQEDTNSSNDPRWVTEIPVPITDELMNRGRERFNIHCATCHGRAGQGNGIVSQRALELQQGTWVPPTSIHLDYVREQPVGQLFNTITNGVRKMPAYGHQIPEEDRWAIVLYMRALQRSQSASIEDVPREIRPTLREMQ